MAYNDYLKGNFDLAVEGFKMYKDQFSASPLADNALYWIGECDYSQRKFEDAVNVFNELILAYPQGDKVAAAYLKKGMSFAEIGRKEEALAAYRLLSPSSRSRKRPGSPSKKSRNWRKNERHQQPEQSHPDRPPGPEAGDRGSSPRRSARSSTSPWPRTSGSSTRTRTRP